MISGLSAAGVSVPGGFATTAQAFRDFLDSNDLTKKINDALTSLDVNDVNALAETGKKIRQWVVDAPLQPELEKKDREYLAEMCSDNAELRVGGRPSATSDNIP